MKKLISLAVSLAVLLFLYLQIDVPSFVMVLAQVDQQLLLIGLSLVLVTTYVSALRFRILTHDVGRFTLRESAELILVGSSLNMVLPSKAGDLVKCVFMTGRNRSPFGEALALVVMEKASDMIALLLFCFVGLFLYDVPTWLALLVGGLSLGGVAVLLSLMVSPRFGASILGIGERLVPKRWSPRLLDLRASWIRVCESVAQSHVRARTLIISIFLWGLHLVQIWLFALALRMDLPFIASLALIPIAILVGLLPFSLAGIGTRDAALVVLLVPFAGAETSAALGLLTTTRYIIPAVAGLPYMHKYMALKSSETGSP